MKWIYEKKISEALEKLGYTLPKPIRLEPPGSPEFGHYASNIAFVLAKTERKNPKELAQIISDQLNRELNENGHFSALNGFINFTFSDAFLWEKTRISPVEYPSLNQTVLLEFVSANPTGPLHIGHGRWAALGDSLARILREIGINVSTEFYVNDAGNQIEKLKQSVDARKRGLPVPEDGYHGAYVKELAESKQDPVEQNISKQKQILAVCRVNFDTWFSEKSVLKEDLIDEVVSNLETSAHAYRQDGALWFRSTTWGDDKDRVLIKSDGSYTYFLADLVYHANKVQRGFTRLINIWGADHHGYVKRVKAGLAAITSEKFLEESHFTVLIGQLVNLFRNGEPVRMSKRTGDMITLEEVIDEIGVDALRYFLIEKSPDTHIEFDLSLAAKQSSENPVFYIQYAHARLSSILEKVADLNQKYIPVQVSTSLSEEERALIWHCLKLSDVVWESAMQLSPHFLAAYALILAKKVQLFYEKSPILRAEPQIQAQRIHIVTVAQIHLKKVLELLGITAPNRM